MSVVKKSFQYGSHELVLETGEFARQAGGAVMVTMDDTVVLVTAVVMKEADPGRDFFPLTINYQEKTFAAGKIPGGFFKREGRPAEKETLTSRLIDRPLRPLFPKGFLNETQVIPTVMSINPEVNPDILAMIGASAALSLSGAPFQGPIGGARVGYINGEYVLNPSKSELVDSDLDLIVAGTEQAVLMVESEASNLSEEIMLGAVVFGHEQMQVAISAIKELAAEVGRPAFDWQPPEVDSDLVAAVAQQGEALHGAPQVGRGVPLRTGTHRGGTGSTVEIRTSYRSACWIDGGRSCRSTDRNQRTRACSSSRTPAIFWRVETCT